MWVGGGASAARIKLYPRNHNWPVWGVKKSRDLPGFDVAYLILLVYMRLLKLFVQLYKLLGATPAYTLASTNLHGPIASGNVVICCAQLHCILGSKMNQIFQPANACTLFWGSERTGLIVTCGQCLGHIELIARGGRHYLVSPKIYETTNFTTWIRLCKIRLVLHSK